MLPPLGNRVRFGKVETPERGPPVYADWLPRLSSVLMGDGRDPASLSDVSFVTPDALGDETLGAPFTLGSNLIRARLDYYGIGFEQYDWALSLPRGIVLHGPIDRSVVHETLTTTVYEQVEEYGGYDCYRRVDRETVVAVSDDALVTTFGAHARQNVELYVDTKLGRVDRLADEDATRLLETVGASPTTIYGLGLGTFDEAAIDPIAGAFSFEYDDAAVYYYMDGLFEAGAVPSRSTLRTVFETNNRALRAAAVDFEIDGRLVTAELRVPLDAFRRDVTPLVVPQITWTARRTADGGVRLTHVAGESVDASAVTVLVAEEPTASQFADRYEAVGPGDELTVATPSSTDWTLRIRQDRADGEATATIYSVDAETIGRVGASDA